MAAEYLDVWLHDRLAGRLETREGTLVFTYGDGYQADPSATPLSLSMPLGGPQSHTGGPAHLFFAGLLPEGRILEYVASQYGVTTTNTFGLLEAIGGDCAGAVSLLPPDTEPDFDKPYYESVSEGELAEMLRRLPRYPVRSDHGGLRLSLAGAQNKLAVAIRGDGYALPHGSTPSTHILKPRMQFELDFVWSTAENEAFCLALARKVGLPAPRSWLVDLEGPVLVLERYDRTVAAGGDAGHVRRIHQEDFCQALAVSPTTKYESEGGPGFITCVGLVRAHADAPVQDGLALARWLAFNYLIGNADAHAKNLCVLLHRDSVQLAPFYDLLSTVVYPEHTTKMAMKIGGYYDPETVVADRHWKRTAEGAGLSWPVMRRALRGVAERVGVEAQPVRNDIERQVGAEVPLLSTLIADVIEPRCQRLRCIGGR